MGYRLVSEVLRHAPAYLDGSERTVLLAIAEDARDSTRISHCGRKPLLVASGLGPRGLRKVFERLARHGFEIRVPIGMDKLGRPLYAVPGQQSTYRVPVFSGLKGELEDPLKGELQDRQADRQDRQAVPEDREAVPGDPPFSQPSAVMQQHRAGRGARPPAHIAMIMKSTGASEDEALAVADLVSREKTPDHLGPFLRRLRDDGELPDWLERVRAATARSSMAAWRASLKSQPACEHGVPGGHLPEPGNPGWVACPIERRRLQAAGGRK